MLFFSFPLWVAGMRLQRNPLCSYIFLGQFLWTVCGYAVESVQLVSFEMKGAVTVQYVAFVV